MTSFAEFERQADEDSKDRETASDPSFMARLVIVLVVLSCLAGIFFSLGLIKKGSASWDGAFWRPLFLNWMESLEWNEGWPAGQWIVWFWVAIAHQAFFGMYYLFKGVPRKRNDGDYWCWKDHKWRLDEFWSYVIGVQFLLVLIVFAFGLLLLLGNGLINWLS